MTKRKKIIVLFLIENRYQFLNEITKILNQGGADGIILTGKFGSELKTNGPYPSILHLASLAKSRFPDKEVGVEVYDIENNIENKNILKWSKVNNLDMLWFKNGNFIDDRIAVNSKILYIPDKEHLPTGEQVMEIKNAQKESESLVLCGNITLDNIGNYVKYADAFVVHRAVTVSLGEPYTYEPKKIKTICEKVSDLHLETLLAAN